MTQHTTNVREDVKEVSRAYPPGTQLTCPKNGKLYQIGVKKGVSDFWMLCETDATKGHVSASVILKDFQRLPR